MPPSLGNTVVYQLLTPALITDSTTQQILLLKKIMSFVALPRFLSFLMLSLVFLLLPVSTVTAQNYRNVSLGSSLTAGNSSSWLSPSGDFAFGFHPLNNKDNSFLLAIWFDKIPDKTIVWFPDIPQGNESSVPRGSKVELTNEGTLVLTDQQGKELWNTPTSGTSSYAAMLDTGNFIITNTNSIALWESFKNPTDTILPTQTLEPGSKLYSRSQNVNSYSKGRFRLRFVPDGNLQLNTAAFPSLTDDDYDAYYSANTGDSDITNQRVGIKVIFNETGDIYILMKNGMIEKLKWEDKILNPDIYYSRATLDPDGVFVQYSHPKNSRGNQSWSMERLIPDNICLGIPSGLGSGACGFNSYCEQTSEGRPGCKCPPRYSFVDPNNTFSDCNPDFIPGCQEDEAKAPADFFEFRSIQVNWPLFDYAKMAPYSEEQCRSSCMNDCQCSVAIYTSGGGICWKKKLPLSNGRLSGDGKALIKVRKDGLSNNSSNCRIVPDTDKKNPLSGDKIKIKIKSSRSTLILVGSILFGSSIFLNLILISAKYCFFFFFVGNKKLRTIHQVPSVVGTNLHSFTYKDLEEATDGFKEELGRGAFGIVYKGEIEEMGSRNHIAVKKLDKVIKEGEKEFKTEVSVIGKTHHKNLVRLLGFCEEGEQRLLVYEFMTNGSLADYLFGTSSKPEWNQRIQIAFGIARGLVYLHAECSSQIIHCDIKPQNILLDECYTARISDFGLAKLLMNDQTRTLTGIRGTRGYVAPEWFRNTQITAKVDVYSFGVVLLEIICCRKNVQFELVEEEKEILADWAYDCYRASKLQDLVENDEDTVNDMRELERLVMIAIWCIQEEPSQRPSMKKVTQMLEGVLDVSVPPCPYPCSTVTGNHS